MHSVQETKLKSKVFRAGVCALLATVLAGCDSRDTSTLQTAILGRWRCDGCNENYWFTPSEITLMRDTFRQTSSYSIVSSRGSMSDSISATLACKSATGAQWTIDITIQDGSQKMLIVDREFEISLERKPQPRQFVFVDSKPPPPIR